MSTSRLLGLNAALLFSLVAGGCSYGVTSDKTTSENIGGAFIKVNQVTTNVAQASGGPVALSAAFQTSTSWATASGNGYWYLNPYGTRNPGDNTTVFIPAGWDRFQVSRAGYDTRVFFRSHDYGDCSTFGDKNPYSSGPYPLDTSAPKTPGRMCKGESFALSNSGENYAKDPDIIVDPRTILDNQMIYNRGTTGTAWDAAGQSCEGKSDSCLRVSVGTPNVGVGDLWLTAPANVPSPPVTQHRYNKTSGMTDAQIPGTFVSDGHPHLHFTHWTQMRLRKIDSTCDTQATATNCAIEPQTGAKQSFCLMETNTFDTSPVAEVYMPNKSYGCTNDGVTISQGIGAGKMDVYTKGLTGQMIPTDGLHGDFWLEVEVNPPDASGNRAVIESDYSNNTSRVKVSIP